MGHDQGTWRLRPPEETWDDFGRHRETVGITRVANMTGLDRVGIPVYNAIRPNSRSLSVSQGKGVTHEAAKVSALMESIEYWHAEHIDLPLRHDSFDRLRREACVIDVTTLPRRAGLATVAARAAETPAMAPLHLDRPLLWVEGVDLFGSGPLWVPFETVTYNRVGLDLADTTFRVSSCGLASGNDLTEAVIHAVCEIIERDALTMWWAPSLPPFLDTLVDPATIDEPVCLSLIEQAGAADLDVLIWDTTSDVGVPVFQVCLIEREQRPSWRQFGPCWGYGCHVRPEIALSRAITEAAQSRVTVIVASRDDNYSRQYQAQHDPAVNRSARELFGALTPLRAFDQAASLAGATLADDLDTLLSRLRAVDVGTAAIVDLTKPELGIPVAKVIIPGLEFYSLDVGYSPGPRSRRAAEERTGG